VTRTSIAAALAVLALTVALTPPSWGRDFTGGHRDALGPRFEAAPQARDAPRKRTSRRAAETLDRLRHWNEIAIDASGLDHTPVKPSETRVFGEQLGPGRSSRAMAIVHIAIFDAVNAVAGGHRSYTGLPAAPEGVSMDAAIARAAHDTSAFDEVKRLGGDGTTTPTVRTERQKFIGIYWAYDGTPSLCAPPRLYNQIAV
jgi:hypothetical protein